MLKAPEHSGLGPSSGHSEHISNFSPVRERLTICYFVPELPTLPPHSTSGPRTKTTAKPKPRSTVTASTTTTTTRKISTTNTTKKPGQKFCDVRADGIYPNPENRGTFYQCAGGRTYLQNCPASLVFNASCLCCDWP